MVNRSSNDSAFKKFLKENKSLTYMLPLLAILAIIAIIIYSGAFSKKNKTVSSQDSNPSPTQSSNAPIDNNLPHVEVLPQIIRSENDEKAEANKNPFESPMKLVGIVYSEEGSTAIIQWGGYSYIVQSQDKIGDSDWTVSNINRDNISITSNDNTMVLHLSDNKNN